MQSRPRVISEGRTAKFKGKKNASKAFHHKPKQKVGSVLKDDAVVDKLTAVFRQHGYDAASLSLILSATGLKKGSLYYRFPQGKAQMVQEVIESRGRRLHDYVFSPLRDDRSPETRVREMLKFLNRHYEGGVVGCLLGVLALSESSKLYEVLLKNIFNEWIDALSTPLTDAGVRKEEALSLSQMSVSRIQGALVLTKVLGTLRPFQQTLESIQSDLLGAIKKASG